MMATAGTYEKLETEILTWAETAHQRETPVERTMRLKIRSYILIKRAHRDQRGKD